MKAIKTIVFTKGAGKIFGIISFVIVCFSLKVNAQFTNNGTSLSSTSTGALTINGVYVGRGNTTGPASGNIAIGSSSSLATATDATAGNISMGNNSLITLGSTGNTNVGIGPQTMQKMLSGSRNTALGHQAMLGAAVTNYSNAIDNVSVGRSSMYNIGDNATENTAVGKFALFQISSGKYNVGVGSGAGYNISGDSNTVIGYQAGNSITTGERNVAIGVGAQVQNGGTSDQLSIQNVVYGTNMNTTLGGKIGIGVSAPSQQLHTNGGVRFQGLTTGGAITNLVGADIDGRLWRTAGVNNCASLGAIPRNDASANFICSQIYDNGTTTSIGLGSATTQTWTSGGAQFGLAGDNITNPTNYRLYVVGWTRAQGYIATSDERLKTNTKVIENASDKILKISGYTYNWKNEGKENKEIDKNKQAGFLAQEIEKVLPEAVAKNSDGSYGLNYNAIMPLLTEGIKEQQRTINQLKLEVEELKSKLNQPNNFSSTQSSTEYFQIQPNPVEQESKIVYKLDNTSSKAMFVIYDLQGKMLKQMDLAKGTKEGQLALNKTSLGKGMFILSLIINNNEAQSKRFLVL